MVAFHFFPWISEVLSLLVEKMMDLGCFRCPERSICQQGSTGSYLILLESPGFLPTNNIVQCFVVDFSGVLPKLTLVFYGWNLKKNRRKGFPGEATFAGKAQGSPMFVQVDSSRWCGPTWCRVSLNWMIPWAPMLSRWKWLLGGLFFLEQMDMFVHFWGKISGEKKNTGGFAGAKQGATTKTMNTSQIGWFFEGWMEGFLNICWTWSWSILSIIV